MTPEVLTVNWSFAEDILPLLGFGLAFIALMMVPVRPGGSFNRPAKGYFAASILCYFLSTLSSIVGHFTDALVFLDPVVTSVELLWVPFIAFGVYALYSHQQLEDAASSQHAVTQAGEMLESVMDTAPAGIVVLNEAGVITFANGEARRLLDIVDDAPGALMSSDWTISVVEDHEGKAASRHDFRDLVAPESRHGTPLLVSWPNGWHRHLVVNTAPFADCSGGMGGAVAAFTEREPWFAASAR